MTALPPSFPGPRDADAAAPSAAPADAIGRKWAALSEAADVVSSLAGVEPESRNPETRAFPDAIRSAGGWRKERAENAVDDLAAMMEPGIAALLSVNARGADPSAAARALLEEFSAARDALLALLPPPLHSNAGRRHD